MPLLGEGACSPWSSIYNRLSLKDWFHWHIQTIFSGKGVFVLFEFVRSVIGRLALPIRWVVVVISPLLTPFQPERADWNGTEMIQYVQAIRLLTV